MGGSVTTATSSSLTLTLKQIAYVCNLKHHEDLRTFLIVGMYYASVIWRWRRYKKVDNDKNSSESNLDPNLPLVLDCLWLLFTCIQAFFTATIVHNCIHCAQFWNYHVNTLWHVVLTHSYGHPVSTLIPGHNLSHHKYVQTPKDVMRTTRMRNKNNLFNLLTFVVKILPSVTSQDNKYFRECLKRGNSATFYRMRFEQLCYYPVQVYLAYYYFQQWWWVILIPQLFAKFGIISMNLLQHDGCLVLKELGETPDPYIAEGSTSKLNFEKDLDENSSESDVSPVKGIRKVFTAETIFDKDIYDEKNLNNNSEDSSTTADSSGGENNKSKKSRKESDSQATTVSSSPKPSQVTVTEEDSLPHQDHINRGKRPGKNPDYLYNPDYNFARDFTGNFINFWTCNNGYHSVHHVRPSMHWTKYPDYSKKVVEPYQHPELRQNNLLWYTLNTFFIPKWMGGKGRVTWDGRPYHPSTKNEPDVDMDWVDVFFKVFNDPHKVN